MLPLQLHSTSQARVVALVGGAAGGAAAAATAAAPALTAASASRSSPHDARSSGCADASARSDDGTSESPRPRRGTGAPASPGAWSRSEERSLESSGIESSVDLFIKKLREA